MVEIEKPKKENFFFKWLKNTFFPIKKEEMSRVLGLAVMFTAIVFMYTVLRQVKDILIMKSGNANVIPPAKVLVMIVAAGLGIQHGKISRKYPHKKAFLISFLPFLAFFVLFSLLFKYIHILHANPETIKALSEKIPSLRYFFIIFGNWLSSFYYVFSEMFGSFILGVSAWQLINFYSTHEQSKRFYPFFGLCAQIGNYAAGYIMVIIGHIFKETKNLNELVFLVTSAIIFASAIILGGLFYFFNVAVKNHTSENTVKKNKPKVHWKESFAFLRKNIALLLVAFLSVWYGLCATSLEIYWKGKVLQYYGIEGYAIFMGEYQKAIAIISFIMVVFGSQLIRRLSWIVPATITPLIVMLAATTIFGMNVDLLQNLVCRILNIPSGRLLYIIVIVGAGSLILFKAAKYTLFDPTKEMFIRSRSAEDAIKIKSLETVVGRFGKGGSSTMQAAILSIPGVTMDTMVPFLYLFVMGMAGIWLVSIVGPLNNEMKIVELNASKKVK